MCGRYALFNSANLKTRFSLVEDVPFDANYNIAPGSRAPVITRNSPNSARLMRWGLVPSWSSLPQTKFSTFNARLESLEESKLYGPLLTTKRCLIPTDGYYEWEQNGERRPHYFYRQDRGLFGMAGLYDVWQDAEGMEFFSFTIITTSADELMRPIHSRMPVLINEAQEMDWLDCQRVSADNALALLCYSSQVPLIENQVSSQVNKASNNSTDLIKPTKND